MEKPTLDAKYRMEVVDARRVVVLSEMGSEFFEGSAFVKLLPFLQKGVEKSEIVERLREEVPAAEVYYALLVLEQAGVLSEAEDASTARLLEKTTVSLTSFGPVGEEVLARLKRSLEQVGLSVMAGSEDDGDFLVVLTDDYLREEISGVNQRAMASGRPWMLAKLNGSVLWMGPVFRPEETGCWECLAQRLRGERRFAGSLEFADSGFEWTAREVVKAIALGNQHELHGAVRTFDLHAMEIQTHHLVRRPQCPACGEPISIGETPAPFELTSQRVLAGEYRTAAPEETLRKFGHHVSPVTGIVRKLERSNKGSFEGLVHNYVAGVNHAGGRGLRSYSGGKGVTDGQAKAGALGEALERYSGRFQGDERRVQASFLQMGELAVHPNSLMLYSEDQFARRDELNARNVLPGRQIPLPFDENAVLEWTPVWSMTERRFKYVPTSSCFFGYPSPVYSHADSNGCAAGNSVEEAILQGFFELVERDHVSLWWYNGLKRGAVDVESFGLGYVKRLREHYRMLGREFWVLDLTHDLGIPTFAAVSRRVEGATEDLLCGFGAHFDPEVALLRALTEMNQFLPALAERERQDEITRWWWRTATVENQPYLRPDNGVPAKRACDFAQVSMTDLREAVLQCQAIAEAKGLEMLVLDLTRPDIGLPVVKVIVPGLRHFWNRFAPGRLYEVPGARQESELNAIPVFF
ncbi:TOMM precursor leader peptide-binding protein [Tumebacillus sp. ITR2]|uniref:TOMM leader peptide-binding protein n=1 Tax=Tumebacillus amylolyticus TaxID=2801339 RepID=A0ABS1JGT8_9BACL|nr:TOMM precursor leader peptide-binding protein [Tumebacillus amylolyticus]MBL0389478.1 TOMM precursor leader peptide-binding protein [Tumebacillus amylolyticus]